MEPLADKTSPASLLKLFDIILARISSTLFELLLLGFATFFPAYLFKVEQPLIIFCQIVTLSITVAFFQGCRSLEYLAYIKRFSDKPPQYFWLLGAMSTIPLNLLVWLYFSLYIQNPWLTPANITYVQLYTISLIGLNFATGVLEAHMQYKAIKQNRPKGAMGLFYPSVGLMLLGWLIVFMIMKVILK